MERAARAGAAATRAEPGSSLTAGPSEWAEGRRVATDTLRPALAGGILPRASFRLRVVAYAFGIELPYSMLVPIAYLRLLNIVDAAEQTRVLAVIGALYLAKTAILIGLLLRMLEPIEQLRGFGGISATGRSADGGRMQGVPPARLILEAGKAAYETPLAFATVWATTWVLFYVPVTAVLPLLTPGREPAGPRLVAAVLLFSLATFAAALPLGYSILGRLLSPAAGLISIIARERGLTIPGQSHSLAVRMVLLGVCLAGAPTSWMFAMVLVQVDRPTTTGWWITLVIFAVVCVTWAPVCAGFLAGAIATPLRQVGTVIEKIIQRGDAERLDRIPIHFKDEVGSLAAGVNAMVDRLQESSARIRSYLAERERLLQDAAQRAAQLQAILDNLVEGVFACDTEGRLTMVNASGLRLLGLPTGVSRSAIERAMNGAASGLDGLSGASERTPAVSLASIGDMHDLTRMRHPDGRHFTREELPIMRALAGETIAHQEQILVHPLTGRDIYLLTSAAPIRGSDGAVLGAVAVARDVTELRELDLVKDQFIRVGAHELKTPVAIMKGYALAMLRSVGDLPPARRKMLEAIDRGADRINRIVDDLLAISQITMDLLKVSQEQVDLGRLVTDAVDRTSESAARHRLHLELPSGRPLVARADPERLRQVLASLLDNAVKYSPDGGDIEVTVSIEPRSSAASGGDTARGGDCDQGGPGHEAVVSIRDHGIGIPASKQGRIFERFFRAHTDTAHDYGGMGVGLFLAKDMIARQGGRMWFESEEHHGSTFHFTVPLEEGDPAHG